MNIDNKRGTRGFFSSIAPYATASSGAALGFLAGGPMGAITGGKLGYELGKGNVHGFINNAIGVASGGIIHTLPITNKRKRE
jgi:hypothetical protein